MAQQKPLPRPNEAPNVGAETVPPGATRKAGDRETMPDTDVPDADSPEDDATEQAK